jgi:L-2-amino-thiazoline-4-carboxylic acid hydrolase
MEDRMTDASELPMLERRRIEAEILKPVYEALVARLGEAAARDILTTAIRQSAIAQGRTFAEAGGGETDLDSFAALLPQWTTGGALEMTVQRRDAGHLEFDVTRCRYAEMYRAMGLGSIGHILSCNRDGTFCEGYDDRIKLERTQTIMGGASHCDFRYRFERAPDKR